MSFYSAQTLEVRLAHELTLDQRRRPVFIVGSAVSMPTADRPGVPLDRRDRRPVAHAGS